MLHVWQQMLITRQNSDSLLTFRFRHSCRSRAAFLTLLLLLPRRLLLPGARIHPFSDQNHASELHQDLQSGATPACNNWEVTRCDGVTAASRCCTCRALVYWRLAVCSSAAMLMKSSLTSAGCRSRASSTTPRADAKSLLS